VPTTSCAGKRQCEGIANSVCHPIQGAGPLRNLAAAASDLAAPLALRSSAPCRWRSELCLGPASAASSSSVRPAALCQWHILVEMSRVVAFCCLLALAAFPSVASAQSLLMFDAASASSVHSAGTFSAEEAIAKGSGYWCRCQFRGRGAPAAARSDGGVLRTAPGSMPLARA
jgi:hypothetical protein